MKLKPVAFDPFAEGESIGGVKLKPVSGNPFAKSSEGGALDPTEGMSGAEKFAAGIGKRMTDWGQAAGQMVGLVDQKTVDETKHLDAPLMNTFGGQAGAVAADLLSAVLPGANTVKGATLISAGLGALTPTATGESRANNTAISGALGYGGAKLAGLVGRGKDAAANRVASLAEKAQAKAAADAAAETASARSLAGRTAQDAYKQMDWLTKLEAGDKLTAAQAAALKSLREELASKAQEKLLPAVAAKEEAAAAFKSAMETETERAAALAADRLSGTEAKNQAMARLKRYGPAVVGGVIGNAIFPGLGGMVGGAATGLTLRPTLHSIRRLAQNPAVQYQALRPIANSGLLGELSDPRYLGLLAPALYGAQQ